MNFYKTLDLIMRQDIGGRGLLPSLPASPLAETAAALSGAKRAVLLTGFPVRLADGSFIGETDGPSGTAAAAAALNEWLPYRRCYRFCFLPALKEACAGWLPRPPSCCFQKRYRCLYPEFSQ
ncbi:MAG: glutamate cyclase domain-containing protein [[Clostridium] symbiosum]